MRIGLATRAINPQPGAALGGYPGEQRTSRGVHDPLTMSAIWIEGDGSGGLLWVVYDGLTVSPVLTDGARGVVGPTDTVLVTASHTHSAPPASMPNWDEETGGAADVEYEAWLAEQIAGAAHDARAAVSDGEVRWSIGPVEGPVGANRRHLGRAGDPEVRLIEFRTPTARQLVVVHGCHPTVLGPENEYSSADLILGLREGLQERGYEGEIHYAPGGAGDQSTRATRTASTFAEARRLGGSLADAAQKAFGTTTAAEGLSITRSLVTLPVRTLPEPAAAAAALADLEAELGTLRERGDDPVAVRSLEVKLYGRKHDLRRATTWEHGMPDAPLELTAVRMGSLTLMFAPVEPFLEIALALEAGAGAWLIGCTNDCRGYFMPDDEIRFGGYELAASPFDIGAWDAFKVAATALTDAVAPPSPV